MPDDLHFMELAVAEARDCGDDVPVGCVIVHQGNVIAIGANQRERAQDPCGHAEIVAMRKASEHLGRWRLHECTLYCTLEPCPMCAEAILQARVSRVVFGAFDHVYGALGSAFNLFAPGRPFPLPEVTGGVMEEECRVMIKEFFKRRRVQNGAAKQ